MTRSSIVAAAILAFALALPFHSTAVPAANESGGDGGAPSSGEIESLIGTLKDDAARAAFVADLEALLAARRATAPATDRPGVGARLLAAVSARVQSASDGVADAAAGLLDLPEVANRVWAAVRDPTRRSFWLGVGLQIVLVIGIGLGAELAARTVLASPRRSVETRLNDSLVVRAAFLAVRTVLDVLPIVAFAAAAYAALPVLRPAPEARLVLLTLIYANLLARVVSAGARMVLAPRVAGLRLLPIPDEIAAYLYIWVKRVANLAVYGYFVIEAARQLGLAAPLGQVLLKLLGFLVTTLLVVFVFQNRRAVGDHMRGPIDGARFAVLRNRFADIWHVLAVTYVVGVFAVWAFEVEGGFAFMLRATVLTLVVLAGAFGLSRAGTRLTERIFTVSPELRAQFPGIERRANLYLPAVQTGLRFIIGLFAGLVLLQAWGLDTLLWIASDAGRRAFGSGLTIIALVVGSVVAWELVSSAVERYLGRLQAQGAGRDRANRLKTLLPLARAAVSVTLAVVVALIVLSELGVNIAPLLASAGVVGLAIGFGAQTLVKDVITGLFILVEDAISVGDVGEVGGHAGVIEAITIRTIRLRDLEGRVHTIPFSEVSTVVNFTKDFSFAFMEIGIAYRENVDHVIEVLKALADEMQADEPWSTRILEPLEVFGLDRFGSSEVVVRVRFKTEPGQQFGVRREFFRRMKARFDELGIEIPFPHVTVYPGQDKAGRSPPLALRLEDGDLAVIDRNDVEGSDSVIQEAR